MLYCFVCLKIHKNYVKTKETYNIFASKEQQMNTSRKLCYQVEENGNGELFVLCGCLKYIYIYTQTMYCGTNNMIYLRDKRVTFHTYF